MSVLRFINNKVISDTKEWDITDILSMKFNLNFESSSSVCFSVKKPKTDESLLREFGILIGKILGVSIIAILIGQYSILIALIFGIIFLRMIIPYYWNIYKKCHQQGLLIFEFYDVLEFVAFQKHVWEHHRGKKLIRHGFVMGQSIEEVFYVFFPTSVYNSDKFRGYLRFFTQVIYPIFVIIIPLFIGFCMLLGKNTKFLYKVLKKDKFVKMVLFIADEGAEFIDEKLHESTFTKIIWEALEEKFDQLHLILDTLVKWLKIEALLIFMQIEYINTCYLSVMKSAMRTGRFCIKILKNNGFYWLINPIEKNFRNVKAVQKIQEIRSHGGKLNQEISDIKEKIHKKDN
jgi:hypothetical protein